MEKSSIAKSIDGPTLRIAYWSILGVLTLVPLVGMAWSIHAVARIAAESVQTRAGKLIGTVIRVGATALIVVWLWYLIPPGLLSPHAWWIVGGLLAALAALFSQRLISLRTQMLGSVEQVLEGTPAAQVPSRWGQQSTDWALNLQEIELPANAVCSGKTIAALQIRRRFGCTIVEINRQGYVLAGPEPNVPLFPGDRLLVLGSAEQIGTARKDLTRQRKSDEEVAAFDDARLDTVTVPNTPGIVGQPLRALRVPHRTGAVVVGIGRNGRRQANPSGDEVVAAGDEWLVIGAAEELRALQSLLAEGARDERAAGQGPN